MARTRQKYRSASSGRCSHHSCQLKSSARTLRKLVILARRRRRLALPVAPPGRPVTEHQQRAHEARRLVMLSRDAHRRLAVSIARPQVGTMGPQKP